MVYFKDYPNSRITISFVSSSSNDMQLLVDADYDLKDFLLKLFAKETDCNKGYIELMPLHNDVSCTELINQFLKLMFDQKRFSKQYVYIEKPNWKVIADKEGVIYFFKTDNWTAHIKKELAEELINKTKPVQLF